MPDDNQSTQDSTTTDNAAIAADATSTPNADIDMSGIDPNLQIPSLEDLEYATPSAYIDPDLPATPAAVDTPEEPEEEAPAEETIEMTPEQIAEAIKASNKTMSSVAEKITDARNILIALSSDPSIDELSAAITLSLFLDRLGKHAIAVYSGTIPSSLGFLNPEPNFEENADVFQDFVISISKEKADHIRYKLDGDFVKIFVTPYKSRIVAEDLEFSYGDYNVDLVLALNVNNAIDLDPSLREYGTIMRDATVINITTGNPGKFGEIEWSNKFASSISEMISDLLLGSSGETKINDHEATTLLTGIVAATDRFAKANTFPGTMQVASKLLDAGADQQLVAANISDDLDNQFFTFSEAKQKAKLEEEAKDSDEIPTFSFDSKEEGGEEKEEEPVADGSSLEIAHGDVPTETSEKESGNEEKAPESPESPTQAESAEPTSPSLPPVQAPAEESSENSALLDELKATEASLSNAGAETVAAPATPSIETAVGAAPVAPATEMVINPPSADTATVATPADVTSKYSQMLEDAIASPAPAAATPMESSLPPAPNPATASAPGLAPAPEVNNMPEINYGQTTDQLLPPPPTPPVDVNASMPLPTPDLGAPTPNIPAAPAPEMPTPNIPTPNIPAPEAPTATVTSASGTFTIPGV